MKKRELLRRYYDMAGRNLESFSAGISMEKPKEGFEAEWKHAKEERDLLRVMLDELPLEQYGGNRSDFTFIGTIDSWLGNFSKANQENFIEHLIVSDREGNARMFEIDYEAGKEILRTYDEERHRRYDLGMNTDIVFTVNNGRQSVKRWEWKVKREC